MSGIAVCVGGIAVAGTGVFVAEGKLVFVLVGDFVGTAVFVFDEVGTITANGT